MKPLSEWTTESLTTAIQTGGMTIPCGTCPGGMPAVLEEILRRERDRCADVAFDLAKEHRERAAYRRTLDTPWDHNFAQDLDELADVYDEVANRIRGLS